MGQAANFLAFSVDKLQKSVTTELNSLHLLAVHMVQTCIHSHINKLLIREFSLFSPVSLNYAKIINTNFIRKAFKFCIILARFKRCFVGGTH